MNDAYKLGQLLWETATAQLSAEESYEIQSALADFKASRRQTDEPLVRQRISTAIEKFVDVDWRVSVQFHVQFGSVRMASERFLLELFKMSGGDIGVCAALIQTHMSSATPASAEESSRQILEPFPASLPLFALIAERCSWLSHPLRSVHLDDGEFLSGIVRLMQAGLVDAGSLAPPMAQYMSSGEAARFCKRAALCLDGEGIAAFRSRIPLLTNQAKLWFDDLGKTDFPTNVRTNVRTWNALKELRPTFVPRGEQLLEPEDGTIRVVIPVADGRLVLHCRAETDRMFEELEWFTHKYLSRQLDGRWAAAGQEVTLDLLEGCPATLVLSTEDAMRALLVAMHPGLQQAGATRPDVSCALLAAVLDPRLFVKASGVRRIACSAVDCVCDRLNGIEFGNSDATQASVDSLVTALACRSPNIPDSFFDRFFEVQDDHNRWIRFDDPLMIHVERLRRQLTAAETRILRTFSPTVKRWSKVIGYAAGADADAEADPFPKFARECIAKVVNDTNLAEAVLKSPTLQVKVTVATASKKNKKRRAEEVTTASAGRAECLAVMQHTLEVAGGLAEKVAEMAYDSDRLPVACRRLLLIAAWQEAVNTNL